MSFFKKIIGGYDELWKAIIRPPRDDYEMEELGIISYDISKIVFNYFYIRTFI
jgi:hypothetical protein